ncbi:MAG: outer membrane protein assembly factor BamD [Sedimentisphaerales bacterium]|nr:outer membrane protein assembly factor BamD [Sedimentisphaerales bacterium]
MLRTICIIALGALLAGCATSHQKTDNSLREKELPEKLVKAQQALDAGKNAKAIKIAKAWRKNNQDSPWGDHAWYIEGMGSLKKKNYYHALESFNELTDNYPSSTYFTESLEKMVDICDKFLAGRKRYLWGFIPTGAKTEALEMLDKVAERWPGSELAATALMKKADYYFKKERFLEAQAQYQLLIDNYAASSIYEPALFGNAEATFCMYNGPHYDARCLSEAIVRYEQYRARFPREAVARGVNERLAEIERLLLEKEREIADFYKKTNKLQAAELYYRRLAQNNGDASAGPTPDNTLTTTTAVP